MDIPSSQKLHIFIHDICQGLVLFLVLNQPHHFRFPFSSTCSSFSFQASDYDETIKFDNDQPIKSKQVNVKKMPTCPGRTLAEQGGTVVHRFSESHHGKHLTEKEFNWKHELMQSGFS